ncbi:MAG: phosphate ABC transporter ATP-binding protein [Dehalococcoidia bacterium]|nr:phosphate ABC transporter ATP-binding protein [Dehalococcoidia bacterium]MSQ34613.1 phosphate ABC transporter ATP-binding protein [Dehalococcoidia bacterium]
MAVSPENPAAQEKTLSEGASEQNIERFDAGEVVIETRAVSVTYGHKAPKAAIEKVTFQIPRNKVVALIGPSGCGKSTLIRCFNRMNELIPGAKVHGDVLFNGENIYLPRVDPTEIRFRIGMVFQRANPFPKSIFENVAFGLRINGLKGDLDEVVEKSLRRAALWDEVKDRLKDSGLSLSGGQQQRLCLARALAVEPEVVLMDEPASALDPISTARIEDLITELSAQVTILIVTHNMQQAARIADYAAVLMAGEERVGRLIEYGTNAQVFGNPKDHRTEAYVTGRIG